MLSIYPSLISADVLNLERTVRELEPYCAGFHLDIMDNQFVPNLTMGPLFVNAVAKVTKKPLWVHIMAQNPETLIGRLVLPAGSIVSIHFESNPEILKTIALIKENNWRASVAIKPKTAPEEIFPLLATIDQVLVMSVEPGFSGQQFLPSAIGKLDPLIKYRLEHNLGFTIGMDGGIGGNNIGMLAQKGVQEFAVASAIFDAADPVAELKKMSALG